MKDDLISRQAAISAIDKYIAQFECIDVNFLDGLKTTKKILNDLPSAEKTGKRRKEMNNNDLIRRDATISYAISGLTREFEGEKWIRVSEVRENIKTMPSAQTEQLTDKEQRIFLERAVQKQTKQLQDAPAGTVQGGVTMGHMFKHLRTVLKHKWVVYQECRACGIAWQGLIHDLSKFSVAEFIPSAKYFQGNRSPIEAEKDAIGYSHAWLHHKAHNKHHWEYWCDYDNRTGTVIPCKIPSKYVIEMVCDWIGAGKVYSKEKWTQDEPLNYFNRVKAGRHFHPETEKLIIELLEIIRDDGLQAFHKACRNLTRRKRNEPCYR